MASLGKREPGSPQSMRTSDRVRIPTPQPKSANKTAIGTAK